MIELLDAVLEGDPLDALAAPLARSQAARPPSGMAAGSAPLLLGPENEAMANQETVDASASIPAFLPHRPAAPLPTPHEESAPAGGFLAAPPVAARRAQSRPVVLPPPTPRPPSGAVPPRPPSGGIAAEPVQAVQAVQGAAAALSPPQPNTTPAPAATVASPARAPAPKASKAHLSAADRGSTRGNKLRRAVDIVVQDRINVHSGKHKDPGDSVDSLYADTGARARLRKLLERGLSTEVRKRIEAGEVKIEVQVWKDYAMVSLLR